MKPKNKFGILSFVTFFILTIFILNPALSQGEDPVPILREGAIISPPPESLNETTSTQQEFSAEATPGAAAAVQIIDFENGADGAVIQSGIPGVIFSTTNRQDWLYADIRTGNYNVYPYGSGNYRCNGNFFAWLGPNQGWGRIDFTQGVASAVTLKYSSYSIVHLEAYGADGALLDSDSGGGNLNQPMGTLSVSNPSIAYVIFHDSGNYWLIDDLEITLEPVDLISVNIPESNKQTHHGSDYKDLVLRRGQTISMVVEASPGYDEAYHTVGFRVLLPDGSEMNIASTGSETEWYAKQIDIDKTDDKTTITFSLHVPGNAIVGKYALEADLSQSNGGTILDTEECSDEFYIIFNPWSGEDTDVYNPNLKTHYALSDNGWNYYVKEWFGFGAIGQEVNWNLGTTDSVVFKKAMEEASGKNSASLISRGLTAKTRYSSGDPATDIILGKWGAGFYKKDWRNVPSILNASGHPTGQCMDMAGVLAALHRTIGIPSRMLTCTPSGGHDGIIWNFHCWGEVTISTNWLAADGTYNIGPNSRSNSNFWDMARYADHIYTYNATSSDRDDIKSLYGVSAPSTSTSLSAEALNDIEISITAEGSPYLIGDEAIIIVTVQNTSDTELSTSLNFSVVQEFYNATTRDLPAFAARNITVPAHGSISESYNIPRDIYQYQGTYRAMATVGTATSEMRFNIEDGLDVAIDMVPVTGEPELYDITTDITNILTRDITDLEVEVHFPGSAEVSSNPLIFSPTIVRAGELVSNTWRARFTERGQTGVVAFAHSEDAGHDKANVHQNVRGDTKAVCWFEEIPVIDLFETVEVTAWVENIGGVATNVNVELYFPECLSITTQTLHTLYDLAPGEKRGITFDLTSSETGRFALTMTTLDQKGNVCLDIGAVTVSDRSREISAQVEPSQVSGNEISHVTLNIQNLTSLFDDVVISSYASNPGVKYAIFENNTKILGNPVNIPANSLKTLDIEILPSDSAELYVTCKSIHDPLAQASAKINIIGNNQPPIANAGPDQTISAGPECSASVTLDGSGSFDPDGHPLTYSWAWDGGSATDIAPTIQLPLGTHTINLVVNDGTIDSEPDTVVVTVIDDTPPKISVSVNPDTLWPPNHKMTLITPIITVSDNCDSGPTVELTSIIMNEGDETNTYDPNYDATIGDGHTVDDIEVDENGNIYLRAERSGTGSGRIYTITYTATDASGNSATANATVTVPHDQL